MLDRLYERAEDPQMPPKWGMYLCLAQDDWGDFLLPCLGRRHRKHGHREPWWDRRFNHRCPGHWPYLLVTVLTGWIVWVEN